jgi:hypothetical protein
MRQMAKLIQELEDAGIEVLQTSWHGKELLLKTSDQERTNEILKADGYRDEVSS